MASEKIIKQKEEEVKKLAEKMKNSLQKSIQQQVKHPNYYNTEHYECWSVWKEIVDSYDFSSRKIVRNKKGQHETINLLVCSCEGGENFGSSGKN